MIEHSPDPDKHTSRDVAHSEATSPSLVQIFARELGKLRSLAQSEERWGSGGLIQAAKELTTLKTDRAAELRALESQLELTVSAAKRAVSVEDLSALEALGALRQTLLSDTFMIALYVTTRTSERNENTNENIAEPHSALSSCCQFLDALAQRYGTVITRGLEESGEQGLARELETVWRSLLLTEDHADDVLNLRPESTLYFFDSIYGPRNPHERTFLPIIKSWVKDRKHVQSALLDAAKILSEPESTLASLPTSRNTDPRSIQDRDVHGGPVQAEGTKTTPNNPTEPRNESPPARKALLPSTSLTDDIDGLEHVGVAPDSRDRGPVRSGNTGKDKSDGRSDFFRNQEARRQAKEADKLARIKAANLNPHVGKTKHELARDKQLGKKGIRK